ncbi:MAG: efflux RND transporter periplasmic adaptor subunit [Chitinophagales bacterium]
MTESVYASVTVQPEDLYDVFAATPGILDHIFINEGDSVTQDQIIAQITANTPKLNIENALLNVDLSRENYKGKATILSSISDEISSTKKQLQIDSINYFRQKNLWEKNVGSRSELETRQLKYELTQDNLDILQKRYEQTSLELENSYNQAQNALKKAKSNLSDYFIKAKINGKVYSVLKKEGELINQQEPLAQIGKSSAFIIELMIDEVDIAKISLGQFAWITLDAYEGEVFEATITKIYPLKDTRTQTFKIEANFNEPPKVLYAGLSGEANILLQEKENALSIPIEFLTEDNKVKTENGDVAVELGMKNMERIEILSGIDTSTVILKP